MEREEEEKEEMRQEVNDSMRMTRKGKGVR